MIRTVVSVVLLALLMGAAARAQSLDWVQQIGSSRDDQSWSSSSDNSGNLSVSGIAVTDSSTIAFLSIYDRNGALLSTHQVGEIGDLPTAVAVGGQGDTYTTGARNFPDRWDSYVSRYDGRGNLLWTSRFVPPTAPGSAGPFEWYRSDCVAAGAAGSVYTSGLTTVPVDFDSPEIGDRAQPSSGTTGYNFNVFVSKYDADGNRAWIQRLGSESDDEATGIATDESGNVYVTGFTSGAIEGTARGALDVFVSKYNADGVPQWTRQFGTNHNEVSRGVTVDRLGNVFVSGSTDGDFAGTGFDFRDAFVSKFAADGTLQWIHQLGSGVIDEGGGVAADGLGGAFVTGTTWGNLEGMNDGESDIFVSRISPNGSLLWTRQFGSAGEDAGNRVSIDDRGNLYVIGATRPTLDAASPVQLDLLVAKFTIVPEPSTPITLTSLAVVALSISRKRW